MKEQKKDSKPTHIIVTGADGQLGQSFQKIKIDFPEYCFHFMSRSEMDLTNEGQTLEKITNIQPQIIINCAAYTAVDKAEKDQSTAIAINEKAVANLASICAKHQIFLIHYSSDYVYHSIIDKKIKEDDPTTPQGIYAQTKLNGEKAIFNASAPAIIIRTSWVYSEFGNNFVKTMLKLAHRGIDLSIVADQIGAPTYAPDIAKASMHIIKHTPSNNIALPSIVNYAGEGQTNWYEFATYIFKQKGLDVNCSKTTTAAYNAPAPRPLWSLLQMKKIKRIFGIAPKYWKEGVRDCLEALEENL